MRPHRSATFTLSVVVSVVVLAATALFAISRAPSSFLAPHARGGEEVENAHVGAHVTRAQTGPIAARPSRIGSRAPATGWVGETNIGVADTWEPSVAADPGAPYVYAMYNRYGGAKACSRCPSPAMMYRVSADNGLTWSAERFNCQCSGVAGQYDPVMDTSSNGTVYATWMNSNTIVFSKSTDHGASFSTPLKVSGKSWGDKPWIGVSKDGVNVYIAYESRSVLYMTSSHNSGATWSVPLQVNTDTGRYRYPNGLVVLPDGSAILAESSYPGGSAKTAGAVNIETWRTTNGGTSWTSNVVAPVYTGVDFDTSSTTTLAADVNGALVIEYSGAPTLGTNGQVWTRRSTDGGITWSAATEMTPAGGAANASFPAITGGAAGVFRLTYMDNRGGAWNTYYRASTDGGVTWSADLKISDATSGATYKTASGYGSGYGDYDAIDITNTGKSVAVMGEGASFTTGPGGIWFNRQS